MGSTGTVIWLNGPSSAGKGTLSRALQAAWDGPLLHLGIDLLFEAMHHAGYSNYGTLEQMPPHAERGVRWIVGDDLRLREIAFGEAGLRLVFGFHAMVAGLAREGNDVVVDDVLFQPEMLAHAAATLSGIPAWLVGVRCDLDELERREVARGDRLLGTAALLHQRPHDHVPRYDVEVDTTATPVEHCAATIRATMAAAPPTAFADIRKLAGAAPETAGPPTATA